LSIETIVREDMIKLYGFRTDQEREWFRLLQTVQGVGAKVALAILSALEPGALATALGTGDKAMIGRAPGVGPKLAQRIVTELKDKAPAFGSVDPAIIKLSDSVAEKTAPVPVADAVSALMNLGYQQAQASAAVAAAVRVAGDTASSPQLIRLALKEMAK
jgi:Holliday junction DNA helicase RuvA